MRPWLVDPTPISGTTATGAPAAHAGGGAAAPPATCSVVVLRNADTGAAVTVPTAALSRPAELRRRVKAGDPQAVVAEDAIVVDAAARSYRLPRGAYPSLAAMLAPADAEKAGAAAAPPRLGFLAGTWWYVIVGALIIAAAAQTRFFFSCTVGTTSVDWHGSSYCVPSDRVGDVTPSSCDPSICAAKVPVTMQTYAVLMNGAIAGSTGVLATLLYVILCCVGAPFGANGVSDPMWNKGAIVGASGGYFYGFVFATMIMAAASARGHDRPRSAYWLVPWLLAAEAAIFACGLFWMPFGLAIKAGKSPSSICPASGGAAACLSNLANWGLVPFLPGEVFKCALVLVTVPALWALMLCWVRWARGGAQPVPLSAPEEEGGEAGVGSGGGARPAEAPTADVAVTW